MTLENLLSQVGVGTKHLTDRYSEPPMHDQHVYYAYEPPPVTSSKHHHSGSGLKSNASMSALTLLAFLFFLHILQQCIKEHMTEMSSAPVMVMTAGREGDVDLSKSEKNDKAGISQTNSERNKDKLESSVELNPFRKDVETDHKLMRINGAEHKPTNNYEYIYKNSENTFPDGFVSAMEEN